MADGRPSGTLTGVESSDVTNGVQAAATAWCVRVHSDAVTPEDWRALTLWLEASPLHAEAFAVVEGLSDEIDEAADAILAALGPRTAEILPFRPPERRPRERRQGVRAGRPRVPAWGRGAIAAAFVGFAAAAGVVGWRISEGSLQTYRTGPGETRSVTLADGSHVRLDAASTMSV